MGAPFERFRILDDADPHGPGVYTTQRGEDRVYVGKSGDIWSRLNDHKRAGMLTVITSGAVYSCATATAADHLERAMIWMLNPSENTLRPAPSGPLWAATLGIDRPVGGWFWVSRCGHVQLNGRMLVDREGVSRAGCRCEPWSNWLYSAQTKIAEMTADADALAASHEVLRVYLYNKCREVYRLDASLRQTEDEGREMANEVQALRAQIEHLEDLRDRAEWTP